MELLKKVLNLKNRKKVFSRGVEMWKLNDEIALLNLLRHVIWISLYSSLPISSKWMENIELLSSTRCEILSRWAEREAKIYLSVSMIVDWLTSKTCTMYFSFWTKEKSIKLVFPGYLFGRNLCLRALCIQLMKTSWLQLERKYDIRLVNQ